MTKLISVYNLSKSFGNNTVLSNISFDLHTNESLIVLGESGCGKSVLLKCILGLELKEQGSIYYNNESMEVPLILYNDFLEQFGMLFQGSALFDGITVWENISFALKHKLGMKASQCKDMAIEMLDAVGLHERVAYLMPAELSGGMKRRVALARAVIRQPKLLFLDEPTAGLDPLSSNAISTLIASLIGKIGASAIIITHDINCLKIVGKRVIMLRSGTITYNNDIKSAFTTTDEYLSQFLAAAKNL